jgi:signal transduction histidine kinase
VGKYLYLYLTLLRSLSAIWYVLMSVLCLREYRERRGRWGGYAYCGLVVTYAVLYLVLLAQEAVGVTFHRSVAWLTVADILTSALIAPLLLHVFYTNEKPYLAARRLWQGWLATVYALGLVEAAGGMAISFGGFRSPVSQDTAFLLPIAVAAVGLAGVLSTSRRPRLSPIERHQRLWVLLLCIGWVSVVVAWRMSRSPWLELLKDACPLVFIFMATYYVERYTFFDVLIKKGLAAFFSFALFSAYFTWAGPWLDKFRLSITVWALSVWPIALVTPWLYRTLSAWLDRVWLGRRFTPAEASRYFLSGLQGAIGEAELVSRAEEHLETIFRSKADVILRPPSGPAGGATGEGIEAKIHLGREVAGVVRLQPGVRRPRFLSEDVALLALLAEAFSFLLENLRLREKRLQQEQREQELILHASRADLKALRAQVNPHFLFNALNAIAGLIPRDPDRAERTIEQLAEVFRYTLRGSQREWVRLEDELEAVRAYLDVEQARFRDGLRVRMAWPGGLGHARIPAMIVHTLVENAVKHGAGAITSPGVVEVDVSVADGLLRITVRDNGPGFGAAAVRALQSAGSGYGLRNVRERLQGHFGDAACLKIERGATPAMTVVTVEMPLVGEPQPSGVCTP